MRLLFLFFLFSPWLVMAQYSGYLAGNDHQIFYTTFGTGKPVLIINGGPGMNSEGFSFMAEKIADLGFQTITYDQRGTGKSVLSQMDSTTLSMELMVQDIEAMRQHFGLKKLCILGHSFGGILAAAYVSVHPDRVEGIIFSSSGGLDISFLNDLSIRDHLTEEELERLQYWSAEIAAGDTSFHAQLELGRALAPAYLYDKKHIPVIAKRLTQGNMTVNAIIWQDLRRMQYNYLESLKGKQFPVLVIQGDHDVMPLSIGEKISAIFPNAQRKVLENCAHYGWLDAPDVYFNIIEKWLEESCGK
jgi:proline iminopeptidase